LENIRFKYKSAAQLRKSGDISPDRFTELEKAYHAREAALDTTPNELHTMANIQALRAELKLSQKRVNDATLRTPFDGAVTAKLVFPYPVYPCQIIAIEPDSAPTGQCWEVLAVSVWP
jgi:multidrug resistance efflux pump